MWGETILRLVCFSLAGGLACGIVGDGLYALGIILSRLLKIKKSVVRAFFRIISDTFFGAVCGAAMSLAIYWGNSGKFRVIAPACAVAIYCTYRVSVGKLFRLAFYKIFEFCIHVLVRITAFAKHIINKVVSRFVNIKKKGSIKRHLKFGKRKDSKLRCDKKRRKGAFHKGKSYTAKEC